MKTDDGYEAKSNEEVQKGQNFQKYTYPFSAIVGQKEMKTALILNLINPGLGGVLIRGEKGTAKSTAVRALAALLPQMKVVELKSGKTAEVDFTITPYLTLEWVDAPYQDADGFLWASFKFTRNAKEGYDMPDVEKAQMIIGTTVS